MDRSIGAAIVGIAFIVVSAVVLRWAALPPTDPVSTAIWVQAVGSLIAVGVAIWFPVYSEYQRRRLIRIRTLTIVRICQVHVDRFHAAMQMREYANSEENFHTTFFKLQKLLDEFPLETLPSVEAIKDLVRFSGLFSTACDHVNAVLEQLKINGAKYQYCLQHLSETRENMIRVGGRLSRFPY